MTNDRPLRRHLSARWYALPALLLILTISAGGVWLTLAPYSSPRPARPVAGPSTNVTFELAAHVDYRIYHHASPEFAGRDCRVTPPDKDATGLSFGAPSRLSRLFYRVPQHVFWESDQYRLAIRLTHASGGKATVSCSGGPVLVETYRERSVTAWLSLIAAVVAIVLSTAVIAWRRRKSTSPTNDEKHPAT